MADYGKKTVLELQKLLREKGLRTNGRKVELVQRLESIDRMTAHPGYHSSEPDLPPAAPSPPWPSASSFRSLTHEMQNKLPLMTKQSLEQYIIYRQASDKVPNNDLNALKKGCLLSEEKVEAMSYCEEKNFHYFIGIIGAAMKKRVAYNIKGVLHSSGEVIYSACECQAGAGPHGTCKHVVAGTYQ